MNDTVTAVGLVHVSPFEPGIQRVRDDTGFVYLDPGASRVTAPPSVREQVERDLRDSGFGHERVLGCAARLK